MTVIEALKEQIAVLKEGILEKDQYIVLLKARIGQVEVEEKGDFMLDPWKHRSKKMQCDSCMWFVVKKNSYENRETVLVDTPIPPPSDLGRCRRRSPSMNGYPAVFRSDWCGDHKLDENKL